MKRHLILSAISVLALTAAAQQLYAAESETAAPAERATRERAVPTRVSPARAAPARQAARPAPAQQTASSQSSWTGSQVGGFGGGNAGGGGFADPVCASRTNNISPFGGLNANCVGFPFNQSLNTGTKFTGGAVYEYKIPIGQYFVAGILTDVSFGKISATTSQAALYGTSPPDPLGQKTLQNYNNTVNQGTNGSVRGKFGVVVPVPGWYSSVLLYGTAGYIRSRVDGTFSLAGSNFNPSLGCFAFASCATNFASTVSWSKNANGFVGGLGAEVKVGVVILVLDWTHSEFGSFDVPLPVAVTSPCPAGNSCAAVDVAHVSKLRSDSIRVGVKFGL